MTFKKSMISIVAAGVIAAGLTGCGSSSSGGNNLNNNNNDNNDTAPSSFEAVDGKIMNATATAYYVDDNNKTVGITLDSNTSTKNITTDVISKGDYTYSLPKDANITADQIRYVEINATTYSVAKPQIVNGVKTFATFIDVDGSGDYNATAGDQLFTGTLIAPRGMKYITPTSTIIAQNAGGVAALTKADYNATVVNNAVKLIAAKLNLTSDMITKTDPSATGAEEYATINAFLADAKNPANLAGLTTAIAAIDSNETTFAGVVKKLATNGSTATKALFTTVNTLLDNGSLTTADLATLNVDKTRANAGQPVLTGKNKSAIADISAIKVDDVNVSKLLSTGDKVKTGKITFEFPSTPNQTSDKNASATVDLVVSLTAAEAKVEDTAGNDKLVVRLNNIGIKNVDGTVTFDTNTSAVTTSYEFYTDNVDANDSYVAKTDVNSTVVDGASAITTGGTPAIAINTLLSKVQEDLSKETNATTKTFYSSKIVDLMAVVVDSDNALQRVSAAVDGNPTLWSTAKVEGSADAFDATGKMVLNLRADMRGNTTGANVAPNNAFTIGNADANNTVAAADTNASDVTSMPVLNNNKAFDMNVTSQTVNTSEKNTTVAFTFGNYLTDKNASNVAKLVKANSDGNTSAAFDVNVTGDDLTKEGNLTSTIKMVATDEFGDDNTTTMNVLINRAPIAKTGVVSATDVNGTWIFSELDATQDINITGNYVTLKENNASDINLTGAYQDVNVSASTVVQARLYRDTTLNYLAIEFNTTLPTTIKTNGDWNISVSDANMTDALGLKSSITSISTLK